MNRTQYAFNEKSPQNSGFAHAAGKTRHGVCFYPEHSPLCVLLRASVKKPAGLRPAAVLCLLLLTFPATAITGNESTGGAMDGAITKLSDRGGEGGVSQSETPTRSGATGGAGSGWFFIGMSAETALYSVDTAAFGGGLTAGYGFDIGAIGLGLWYLVDTGGLTTYAPHLFFRFYLPVQNAPRSGSGPFLQFTLGPSFHAWNPRIPPGSLTSAVSAGLSAGWRFLLGKRWYIEPVLRAGYPFITGAGSAAGYRL